MPRTRLMRRAALSLLVIVIGTVAGCAKGGTAVSAALASGSVSLSSSSSSAGPSSISASGSGPAAAPQPGTVDTTEAAPGKTVRATVKTTVKATTTVSPTMTVEATPAFTSTTSTTPAVTVTPPHTRLSESPTPTPPAPGLGPCTVTGGTLTAQYTLATQAETAVTWFYLYISEYDATGTLVNSVRLSFLHPFTVGEDLTGTAAVDALVVSCQITNATGAKI